MKGSTVPQGYNLSGGVVTRSFAKAYPKSHTSFLSDATVVTRENLCNAVNLLANVCMAFEGNYTWVNQSPYSEPQLDKRGLCFQIGKRG